MNPQQAFLEMLVAMMSDAAVEGKISQCQSTIDPDGKGVRVVRIVVMPEKMDYTFDPPLGSQNSN
jgi:hypothetical protein